MTFSLKKTEMQTTITQPTTIQLSASQPDTQATVANQQQADASYDEIISDLNASGVQTTRINEAAGEANFGDYAAALSPEMKALILNSFDCPEDYILQQEIAGLFRGDNAIDNGDFATACRNMGYEVQYESIKSTMIPDNKGDGRYDRDIETHHLAVYTITNPETGASIKIVDSNGNGAIEVEELFLNQILQEVAVNIDTSNFGKSYGVSTSTYSMFNKGYNPLTGEFNLAQAQTEDEEEANKRLGGKTPISQAQYIQITNEVTKEIMSKEGLSHEQASQKAERYVGLLYCVGRAPSSTASSDKVLTNVSYSVNDKTYEYDLTSQEDVKLLNAAYGELLIEKSQAAIMTIENDESLTEEEKQEKLEEVYQSDFYISMLEVLQEASDA